MDDTVLFISAYNPTSYKATTWALRKLRRIFPKKNKGRIQSLLAKYHLSFVATDNSFVSIKEKADVQMQYDYIHQTTKFCFRDKDISDDTNIQPRTEDAGFYFNLRHAQSVLVDDRYFKIDFTYGLEPFLVWIDGRMYQIDSFPFMMNSVLFIVFETIDYKTGKPLTKNDVGIKAENFNLLKVEKYQYFDDEHPETTNLKISELIYNRIGDFSWELTNKCYREKEYLYIHDTLVLSNSITSIPDYLCKIMGVKSQVSEIRDISTVGIYEYYPQDGCSVIANFDCTQFNNILYSAIILETVKLYFYAFQLTNLEDETDLNRTIRNDIYLKNLFCSPSLPIETHNLLDFIKESESYKKHAEAMQLKIFYMKAQNDLKKNRNSTILNALLYVISLLGAISTLDVIEDHFGVPFKWSFWAVVLLFVSGIIWWIIEYRNNKSL